MHTTHLLVADDNPVSLQFLVEAARDMGFTCRAASDGDAALALGRVHAFALLLLDARMPGLGGAQVLAALRAEPGPSRHADAFATTADPAPEVRRELLHAGFGDVLVKPLALGHLRQALRPWLGDVAPVPAQVLDDAGALAAAGGDAGIVAALRKLFAVELDALPAELATISARRDAVALHDRLHRLQASAGFCGAPALQHAATSLRQALADQPGWPQAAQAAFLARCAQVRALLPDA